VETSSDYEFLVDCLACGGADFLPILSLGSQPLANDLKLDYKNYNSYPLDLQLCSTCFHAQLTVAVDPATLFSNYVYESGTSQTLRDYFGCFVEKYIDPLGPNLKVVDIASNDGSFLEIVKQSGHRVIGVDPASNLLNKALSKSVVTVNAYWPDQILDFMSPDIDVFVAMNVLAHVKNPLIFLEACRELLAESGVILIQTSQAKMIELGQFDTMYHEHLSFFNTKSMSALAKRAGLKLVNVEYEDIHGLSYVWMLVKEKTQRTQPEISASRMESIIDHENEVGLFALDVYKEFASNSHSLVSQIRESLETHREKGYFLVGYGVAAKGNTVIQFGELHLDALIDDSPAKQGLRIPKSGTQIYSSDLIMEIEQPICFLIPAWNFKDEIVKKIKDKRTPHQQDFDRVIVYFPHFTESAL
jgi:2-polyprenyl-3-methyl-5-hydroxy-6-metoxy-1,4-benzoquinol methylase